MGLFGRETPEEQARVEAWGQWARDRNPYALASAALGIFSVIEFGIIPFFSIAGLVLGIVAAMSVTPPARHTMPVWPLPIRLSLGALEAAPEIRSTVLVGSQVAVLGMVALLASLTLRRLRLPFLAGGVVVLVAGLGIALPPLVTDAYPTTYRRPDVPYHPA